MRVAQVFVVACCVSLVGAACSGPSGGDAGGTANDGGGEEPEAVPLSAAEQRLLLGDDVVADVFSDVTRWPADLQSLQRAFGVGTHCAEESAGVFLLVEPQVRPDGRPELTPAPLPHVVIDGCNVDPIARSALYLVMVGDPTRLEFDAADPLPLFPLEIMARDRTTQLFNFYDLRRGDDDALEFRRFRRSPDGHADVVVRAAHGPRAETVVETPTDRRCFDCHENATPLFNEQPRPWAGWHSDITPVSWPDALGETGALVARRTNAFDLETQLVASTQFAAPYMVERAFGGDHGEWTRLWEGIACATELHWAPRPLDLYVNPEAVLDDNPTVLPIDPPGLLYPVRAAIDRERERVLAARGILTPSLRLALRLLDLDDDAVSDLRCSLLPALLALPRAATPTEARGYVAAVLRSVVDGLPPGVHREALELLLEGGSPAEARSALRPLVRDRLAASTDSVAARARTRLVRVREWFPGPRSALPASAR